MKTISPANEIKILAGEIYNWEVLAN